MDGTAASVGNSAISSTGAVPTTNPNDLIIGANTVYTYTNGPGTGFTNRVITSPDGNIAEDMIAASAGSYSATAPLCCAGSWVMQMVAFKGTATGPLLTGKWATQATLAPVNPVHAALLNNGKILLVAGSGNCPPSQSGCPKSDPYSAYVYDPVAGTLAQNTQITWDMFCNGAALLADGRVLFAGGTLQYDPFLGAPNAAIFDPSKPVASAFTTTPNVASMGNGRWYPTLTTLGNGQVMAVSGLDKNGNANNAVELYNGSSWIWVGNTQNTGALYPRLHLLPNGKVFYSGPNPWTFSMIPSTDTWSFVAETNYGKTNNGNYRTYGTSVLLPLTPANGYEPKVMIMGGDNPATNTTEIIDLNNPAAGWQWGPPMSQPRIEMNAVILPTGKILAVGGSTYDEDATHASLNADLYDPVSNTFSSAGANTYPRLYHSVALLLPDATVWLAGGNPQRGTYEKHMEIYQPGYLFTGTARPVISNAPALISFSHPAQNPFQVTLPAGTAPSSIASVVLVRMGAVTHAFNTDQRLVGFSFTTGTNVLNVALPSSSSYPGLLPPGYYMLFVVNTSGVPSRAWIMQVQL